MTIERARLDAHARPWGVTDLRPWSQIDPRGELVGEIWYERSTGAADGSALQLKFLFTSQPLSIQVHPNDAQAQDAGFSRGKTEAWYVLKADPGARVALGLKHTCGSRELKVAAEDGSIVGLVDWQSVAAGDVVDVPAGTIHAIGTGLVIAEIQQRSDVTYRLFDHGRGRDLHLADALAVAQAGPSTTPARPRRLTEQRQLLSSTPHFTFERITLSPEFLWSLDVQCETWLVVIEGSARAGAHHLATGDAIFVQEDEVEIQAGESGVTCLAAYASPCTLPYFLQRRERSTARTRHENEPFSREVMARRDRATILAEDRQ